MTTPVNQSPTTRPIPPFGSGGSIRVITAASLPVLSPTWGRRLRWLTVPRVPLLWQVYQLAIEPAA